MDRKPEAVVMAGQDSSSIATWAFMPRPFTLEALPSPSAHPGHPQVSAITFFSSFPLPAWPLRPPAGPC